MEEKTIGEREIREYGTCLIREEKSTATVEKYTRSVKAFAGFAGASPLTKETVIAYKAHISDMYTAAGANGMIAAINSFLMFLGRGECRVKPLKTQKRMFAPSERELSRAELDRLLDAARRRGNQRLCLLMQTMFATGVRVSELRFITVGAVLRGKTEIRLKGKTRTVFLPTKLREKLKGYIKSRRIERGPVFITRGGKPLDRSNIWGQMKGLCAEAKVPPAKVFPHNLRHLFARTYYGKIPNLSELASLLGHSDINTTRIYTAASGANIQRRLDSLRLIL